MGFLEKSQVAEGISWVCELGFDSSSSCIQRIVTDGLNLLFLFVFILVLLVGSLAKRSVDADRAKDRGFLIVSILCVVPGFAYLGYGILAFLSRNNEFNHWIWLKYLVRGLVWMGVSVSLSSLKIKSVRILSLVWWVSFSVLISVVNVNILVQTRALPVLDIVAWPVNLLLLFCSVKLLRTVISQRTQNQSLSKPLLIENGNKEVTSTGFFSSLTFSWINPLLSLGYLKPLVLQDVPALEPKDDALLAYQAFRLAWETQRKENPEAKNLVLRALADCYLKEMVLVGLGAFIRSISILVSPLLLYGFVKFSERKEQNLQGGLLLVAGLVLAKIVESLSQRQWFFNSRRIGMRMRSALMVAIFQKQLKLSSLGRKNHSTGEIVNYVAVDAYRFGEFPWWFHSAWSYVMQLIFSICILFGTVGWGALPGLVPIFLCALLNVPFAKMLQNCQSKFMNAQDERLRATSEILNSMKIIKLQSWEEHFKNLIETLRAIEFKWLASIQINKSYGTVLYWMSPIFISAVIFAGCAVLRTAPLVPTTIFTVLATLRIMSEPVRMIPEALSSLIQVKVSFDRIDSFLLADELKEDVKKITSEVSDHGVRIHGGVFSWDPDGASPTLKNIDLHIRKGDKIAVCGPVGAGKSSLLYAVLGEIPKLSGSVEVSGSIAYVSQTAWIQSGTIRENILYGKPMIKTHYEKAIKSCALDKDLESFNYGDLTEIGQRGLNMSGGQKQRIQLARAVYNDADIYLLDDPFSAVDAHTASILFNHCVMEALEGKTVVLVTHQVEFLAEVDRILVLEGGNITQLGSYEELLKDGTAFEQLINAHRDAATALGPSIKGVPSKDQRPAEDHPPDPTKSNSDLEISVNGVLSIQLTEDEEKETGDYGWKPFIDYIHLARGSLLLVLIILSQSGFVIFQLVSSYWLAIGVQIPRISSGVLVGVYTGLSIFAGTFAFLRSRLTAHLGLKASTAFFSGFMNSIFKAPMLFFDSTPVGRILTRLSSDVSILDFDIPYSITFTLVPAIEVVATLIAMSTVTWQVLIVAIPVMLITSYVQGYYLASARELVRINGTTKAPIMNYAAETSLGVITVRAFSTMERFIDRNLELVDIDARLFFHTNAALEWLLLRIEALQNITLFTSTLLLVLLPPGAVTSGFAGLSLSYALTLTGTQVFMSRWYCYLANYIISIERIKQYMNLPSEPPAIIDDKRPPPSWPIKGRIDFQDLRIRYRPNAPMILKGITCTFEEGSRVGVVGRTGSGKTTLISALFRLVDPTSGRILIDGIDICSIGLKDLRMKLSVIPQEPTLFKGSIRSNLDPLGLYSDHEIWKVIEKCQLLTAIRDLPNQLDSSVSDEGENWSAGQRQLFCLGRVLLRRNKILVLDEATASIDSATDVVLQRVIREEFSSCTVITVAHRVPTVIDSDMVMVLSYGKLVEYDNPSKLMETNSSFAKLVAEYWSNCSRNSTQNLRLSMDKEVLK